MFVGAAEGCHRLVAVQSSRGAEGGTWRLAGGPFGLVSQSEFFESSQTFCATNPRESLPVTWENTLLYFFIPFSMQMPVPSGSLCNGFKVESA